ncbi:hypothetical protein M5K25_017289 [Dendrobium thyrsiflorum]|uniref:RING-type domain-containing protein n=1 Tax=Dendrobium thyrsiflorum TaxID=117978 RepID=A0ABD0UMG2_DENTH
MNNNEMDTNFSLPLLGQSHVFFCGNEGNVNRRKRGREETPSAAPPQQQQQIIFSLQPPAMLDPFQLQSQTPSLVSTGLHLALVDQQNNQIKREQPDYLTSAYFSEELAARINKEKNEIDQYLIAQGEQLRRALAERHQRYYRTLLESAGKKLLEKDAEIERAGRCISELQDRLTRIQTESMEWKVKAMTDQATAASLHAQLQKAAVEAAAAAAAAPFANENCGESPAEDAESAHVDPNRIEKLERPCRACFLRPAMVVLLPCCHLSLCVSCDFVSTVGDACPACGIFRTGSLQVSFT